MKDSRSLVVGLTGNTGSGKSIVTRVLKERGAEIIDADLLGHKLLKNEEVKSRLVNTFGRDIIDDNGEINRETLSRIVFADDDKLIQLNRIIHPELIKLIYKRIEELTENKEGLIVVDAALIPEWNIEDEFDILVTVSSPLEKRIERVMEKFDISKEFAMKRIGSQMAEEEREKMADIVIHNDNSIKDLEEKTVALHSKLMERINVL